MSDNIKVVVKVRPLISREIDDKLSHQWRVGNNTLSLIESGREQTSFTFDKVYDESSKTSEVYNDIAKPIVEAAMAGFNGTIFAYGQTSSGKTYTMTGTDSSPGIIPLAISDLFEFINKKPDRDFLVRVSYLEIYNETVRDLLDNDKKNIKIHDTISGVKLDVKDRFTATPEEVFDAMKQGNASRLTGATNMNEESSRSHSIFQIIIESREHIEGEEESGCVKVSQLNLVDLAGSERAGQTGATGLRFKEGTHINKSLSSLALVIKQLSEEGKSAARHINYRDSKLTRILQNSLGGNAKTSIICAVTPAAIEETISTLQFANRAKAIKNKPEVNEVATDATMIQRLTKQLSHLQTELQSKMNVEQVNVNLQKQIADLRRVILTGLVKPTPTGRLTRKMPARRATISALQTVSEDSPSTVPKFRTPSLKYNPLNLPGAPVAPPASEGRLFSVPEEGRVITPPPGKHVGFGEDVIEIDSDDDDETCSPYHGCYKSSKTPPCVLRKTARQAKKTLNDLVELTEREKIYAPEVNELMEQLERKARDISILQEEVNTLHGCTKEKDTKIQELQLQINKAEEDLKNLNNEKDSLECRCKDQATRLTDCEVSYETLKTKAKNREQELLSLLEENTVKKVEEIGKTKNRTLDHFMDLSKDISLVTSDNESSINCPADDDSAAPIHDLVKELQLQINSKIQVISELESNILMQKQAIDTLEITNAELNQTISNLQDGLAFKLNENDILKSSLDTQNSTISKLKDNLETANRDIESYNNVVRELQIKLANKETILNGNINDSLLESMILNEQNFIANNENINNIILSFKRALDNRNKEIIDLNSKLTKNNDFEKNKGVLEEELQSKENFISSLRDKVEKLTSQFDDSLKTIIKMEMEKEDYRQTEQDLTNQLNFLKDENSKLNNLSEELNGIIKELKENNEKLTSMLSENEIMKQSLSKKVEELSAKSNDMLDNIVKLQEEIRFKDNVIASLKDEDKKSEEFLSIAKLAVIKLQGILNVMKSDTVFSENIDELVVQASTLQDRLNILESVANKVMSEKEQALQINLELKKELAEAVETHSSEIINMRNRIQSLINTENEMSNNLSEMKNNLTVKTIENENMKKLYEEKIDSLKETIKSLECTLRTSESELLGLRQDMTEKAKQITNMHHQLNSVNDANLKSDALIYSIYQRITLMHCKTNHTNSPSDCQGDIIQQIIEMLDDIDQPILNNENICKGSNLDNQATDSEESKNIDIQQDSMLTTGPISEDIDLQTYEKNELNMDLQASNELLYLLRQELKTKSHELQTMEAKVLTWKEEFTNLDKQMKQQMEELTRENESLKKGMKVNLEHDISDGCSNSEWNSSNPSRKSMSVLKKVVETYSPKSLCSMTLEKVFELFENNAVTNSNSTAYLTTEHSDVDPQICCCYELTHKLSSAQQQISEQTEYILKLKSEKKFLLQEHDIIRNEVNLLLEPANELQKRIVNHRTNLSTLTATTFAENKLLKSQVTALHHHHKRFHTVCQRDIPAFKKQLLELITILQDPSFTDRHDASFKRYSLPDVLDSNTTLSAFKNESTLDGDLLMLDTNVTLTTIDNTLMGYDQTCLDITQNDHTHDNMSNELSLISDFKVNNSVKENNCLSECEKCVEYNTRELKLQVFIENLTDEVKTYKEQLNEVQIQKNLIEEKYNNLTLEMPSTEILVKKLSILEKENMTNHLKIEKLIQIISVKTKEFIAIQDENDSLSNQVMDNISELDNLKKEFDALKDSNAQLTEEYLLLKSAASNMSNCPKLPLSEAPLSEAHLMFNRSLSDSENTTRFNKICTLQSELQAGKEDCKELTQEVATIKNHLERSNISTSENMDLDDSMGDSNHFSFTKDCSSVNLPRRCKMPDISEECDVYSLDKQQCLVYYVEKTGVAKESLDTNLKIIEIMKSFYDNILAKHGNEVQNLMNKLHDYEDLVTELKTQFDNISSKYLEASKQLEEAETGTKLMSMIRHNLSLLKKTSSMDCDSTKLMEMLNKSVLSILDAELGISSVSILKTIIDKHQHDLTESLQKYSELHDHMENVSKELSCVNDNFNELKSQLLAKENEYNLLKAQKEAVHEISNAVTLDIIKKDNELKEIISNGYMRLVQDNIINQEEIDLTQTSAESVKTLFERLQNKHNNLTEINNYKSMLDERERELINLKLRYDSIQQKNQTICDDLAEKEKTLQEHKRLYETMLDENKSMSIHVRNLSDEVQILKTSLCEKEACIQNLEDKVSSLNENNALGQELRDVLQKVGSLEEDLLNLRSVNKMIITEKDEYAIQLEQCGKTIKQNNCDLQKMTSEILILRESVKEKSLELDQVKAEVEALYKETANLKEEVAEKCRDHSRLEINIKTHEKTAEIQSKMIIRLQKQKDENEAVISEKDKQLHELTQKCKDLQVESESMRKNIETAYEESSMLKKTKLALEERISKLENDLKKQCRDTQKNTQHMSGEKNALEDDDAEAVFGSRSKPDDLFMDVDDESSDRSTPNRLSRGRDSLASRMDHSSSLEPRSRPSSVQATRRRRQSLHDALRTTLQDTSRDRSRNSDDLNYKSAETSTISDNEVARLKERLSSCERELEELKETYQALDEECEICATYLREREQQVSALKKEKKALELELSELKSQKQETGIEATTRSVVDASVNTDEDWANLHSVVVDRMSYDAEVDKNKRLTKTIEELRFKKQDLKNTLAKMQKALEKSSCNRELEATKTELRSCKQELSELRVRYKELDEECETCALYLREKDEQLRKLRDAKAALEAKISDYSKVSSRTTRRAAHDLSRDIHDKHVAVQTTDDLLMQYVEKDNNTQQENELKQLKKNIEKLCAQKASLEQQLAKSSQQSTMYVAAGSAIVQNQQICDIMKENHKLKKMNAKLIDICKKRGKPLAEANRGSISNVENVG